MSNQAIPSAPAASARQLRLPAIEVEAGVLPFVAGLLLIVAAFVALAVYLAWHETLDDAAISLAYSKNLIHGHGLVLTPGAEPVEGYSNFLWVLIMAPLIGLHIDGIIAVKVIGLALSVAALLLLARVPSVASQRRANWLDLLAPALTACSLPFALWAVSGLENGLETFLIVLAVLLSMRELNDDVARPWSAVAFFALALTRPEGVVFWVAAIAHRALLTMLGRRQLRRDLIWLAACLVPLGLYHGWHYAYFGELVPNTYFAKADQRTLAQFFSYVTDRNDPGVTYLRSFGSDYRIVIPLVPFALLSLGGRDGLTRYALPLLMLCAGAAAVLFGGGDWMPYHRFVSPLLPLFFLNVQQGLRVAAGAVSRVLPGPRARTALALSAIIAALFVALTARVNLTKADEIHDRPYAAPYSAVLGQGKALDDLAERFGVDQATVLIPDIGGVAYGTDLKVIDLGGLADRFIAKHQNRKSLADYIFEKRKPDLISMHGPWFSNSGLANDPRMATDYITWSENRQGEPAGLYIRNDILVPTRSCREALSWESAANTRGQPITVRGPVVAYRQARLGGAVVLDIGALDKLRVVVSRPIWSQLKVAPDLAFSGKTVCVSGVVKGVLGTPTITIDSLAAIALQAN